jgi:hypothetical protein
LEVFCVDVVGKFVGEGGFEFEGVAFEFLDCNPD